MRPAMFRLIALGASCCGPIAPAPAFASEGPSESSVAQWVPPTRPDRTGPFPGELERTADAWRGDALPGTVASCPDGPATAVSSFTAVPTSATVDLLADRVWAEHMVSGYPVQVARLEDRIAWLDGDSDRAWAQVENLSRDPFLQRPGTQRAIGAIGGAASVLVGAWALQMVAE